MDDADVHLEESNKKSESLNPRERDRLVRVFNFFNGALEKKLGDYYGRMNFLIEKIECQSADDSI